MAEVHTQVEISPTVAPFDTSRIRDIDNTGIPWGQLSHVDQFNVPAIGSGDTGLLSIYCLVPNNYWLQLKGFHIDMAQTTDPEWNEGIYINYFTGLNSLSSGYDTQDLNFPVGVTSDARIGSNEYKNVGIASTSSNGGTAYQINSPSNYLIKGVIDSPYECPTIRMYNTAPGSHVTTFRVALIWKMYDLNQGNHPWLSPNT